MPIQTRLNNINDLINQYVFGINKLITHPQGYLDDYPEITEPKWASDLDQAFSLLKKIDGEVKIERCYDEKGNELWQCSVNHHVVIEPTLPLAICSAVLWYFEAYLLLAEEETSFWYSGSV